MVQYKNRYFKSGRFYDRWTMFDLKRGGCKIKNENEDKKSHLKTGVTFSFGVKTALKRVIYRLVINDGWF